MQWPSLLALALIAPRVHAMLRFECSQLVIQSLDPLVQPGQISSHVHQIVGGNAFNITMDPNNDLPKMSTCTTCTFSEDFSNYWTAVMYFKHPNGSFKRVPQRANQFLEGNGGMTVYYIPPYTGSAKTTAFKKGFRMLVGDPMVRARQTNPEFVGLSFRCFEANWGGENGAPGTGRDTRELPNKFCPGGIRANIFFPTCWDGVNLDSTDHKSHVAYPTGVNNPLDNPGGRCPRTHPVQLPQLFTETIWDTREFQSMWPKDGSQPLVFSMGDPTGLGQHADYVFGWQGDALQRAMDANCNVACPQLKSQNTAKINACTQRPVVNEVVDGWLDALPGCNPIQKGPDRAIAYSGCGKPATLRT